MDFLQVQEQRVMAVHKLDDEVNQLLFLTSIWWFRFDVFKWVMSLWLPQLLPQARNPLR